MIFGRSGMGYVGAWDAGGAEISIDHLRRRGGELHGELMVSAAIVARGKGHIHRASFNLSSTTARDRLARVLVERTKPNELPWGDMLEEFCSGVLDAERRGTPIIKVGNLPARPDETYLIDPLLPAGKTTIVFGAGGTGKSYLGVLAAVCVASGRPMLGWPVRLGSVLYLDWETDGYEIDERIKRVAAGMGVAAPDIAYRSCAAPLEDMAEELARIVAQGITLTIVDSVGMASGTAKEGGDANESALRLFMALRYLGSTVLAIDHVTGEDVKSDKAVAKPYGSIYKVNLARSVWELRGSADGEESHLGLFHRKVNKGSLRAPIGIRVRHGEYSATFEPEEIQDDALVLALGNSTRILRALGSGPMTPADIAEETGIGPASVRTTLNRGRDRQFVKLPDGRWGAIETRYVTPVSGVTGKVA